jgi:hypothetical protein
MRRHVEERRVRRHMKAISIRAPWAWAILHAGKDVENRTWNTNMRGIVAVHASQTMSRTYYEEALEEILSKKPRAKVPSYDTMVRGAIIGVVEVVDCKESTKSKWHVPGHKGFVLTNPRSLKSPIACKGWLNFWEVPENVARSIRRQMV